MTTTALRNRHIVTDAPVSTGDRIRKLVARFAPLLLLVLLLIVVAILDPATVAPKNLVNVLINATPVAVLALGAMWILIAGGLDLSAGFGVAMAALVIGGALQQDIPLPLALLSGVIAGVLLGLVNGLLIGLLRMPPGAVEGDRTVTRTTSRKRRTACATQ